MALDLEHWSEDVMHKAETLLAQKKVTQDEEHEQVFYVQGNGKKPYRVQTDNEEFWLCSCPNGNRVSRPRCYHTGAVALMLKDRGAIG